MQKDNVYEETLKNDQVEKWPVSKKNKWFKLETTNPNMKFKWIKSTNLIMKSK